MAGGPTGNPCWRKLWNGYSVFVRVLPLVAKILQDPLWGRTRTDWALFKITYTNHPAQSRLAGENCLIVVSFSKMQSLLRSEA